MRMSQQADVKRPVRMKGGLDHATRARPWAAHARMGIAIARPGHRHIDGEDQLGHAQSHGPLQRIAHEGSVLQHIELEPYRPAATVDHFLHRADADSGQDVGHAGGAGGASHLHLAPSRRHAAQADGRQRHRHGHLLAEQLGRQAQARDVAQDALTQRHARQIIDIVAQRLLGEGAAIDIVEQEARQTTARRLAKVGGRGDDHDRSFSRRSSSNLNVRSA
ncbi:hypothetical protein D3C73_646370 [compost metagenome]